MSDLPPSAPGSATTQPTAPAAPVVQPGSTLDSGPATNAAGSINAPTTKLQLAAKAGPKLDPKTTLGVAQTASSPSDAAVNAQVVQVFDTATKLANVLGEVPARAQLAFWNRASAPERDLLDAAGYKPPSAPPQVPGQPDRGFLGNVWHDVAHGFDEARHGAAQAGSWLVHKPLAYAGDVANVGMGPLEHGIRSAIDVAQVNDLKYQQGRQSLGADLHALIEPSQWVRAWHQTANGAAAFQPQVVRYLQRTLSPQQLTAAKLVAEGQNLQTVLGKVPQDQRAQLYASIEANPDFQSAVQLLSDSHLDLGQAIFGGLSTRQLEQMLPHAHNVAGYNVAAGALGGSLLGLTRGGPIAGIAGAIGGAGAQAAANAAGTTADQLTAISPFGIQVHPLSALTDGLVDWYDSPLVIGTSLRSANLSRRFAILDSLGNARDARALYATDPAVQRGMDAIAQAITTPSTEEATAGVRVAQTPNISAVIRRFPQLNALADDLVAHYPAIRAAAEAAHESVDLEHLFSPAHTIAASPGAEVANLFASDQALLNLARGRAGLFFNKETLFPHLTVPQALAHSSKDAAAELIQRANGLNLDRLSPRQWARAVYGEDAERAGSTAARKPGPVARFARRATTLTPLKDYIDLTDPDRASVFQRYAEMFLPPRQADALTNAFMAVPPTDQGRQIAMIHALQDELFAAAGLDESLAGERYVADWQRKRDLGLAGEHYSFGNNAFYRNPASDTDVGREHAILPSQLSNAIAMPQFSDLYKLAKKSWAAQHLGAVMDSHALDRIMARWKALLLLRPGFGLRVAGEELLGASLREGGLSMAQTRLAASLLGIESPVTPAMRRLSNATIGRLWQALTGHIPGEALRNVESSADLNALIYGWRGISGLRRLGLSAVPEDILDAAKWWAVHGRYDGPLAESIDALTQHTGGIVDDEHGWSEAIRRWDGGETVRMSPTGKMRRYGRLEEDSFPAYHYALSGIAMDEPGRAAVRAIADGKQAQTDAVLSWLEDPANREVVDRFAVAHMTPDGREVATGEASRDEALRAWAEKVVAHVNHYVVSAHDGRPIMFERQPLAARIAAGDVPKVDELEAIDRKHLPDEIVARELLPKLEGFMSQAIEHEMQEMVGRPLNYLSRQPIFLRHFATAFKESKALVKTLGIEDHDDELAGDIASERAWREALPYLHNPRVRSQMSVIHRNLAPFWFAQEQFYKRWAKTFATYPEAFRKAQLLMNGLRSVGFVQKDSYGQDAFVYPGSGYVTSFLAKVFGAKLPVVNQFTSEISQLNPSFATGGVVSFPSPGPFVSIPLETLNAAIPELDPFVQSVMGTASPKEDHRQAFVVQAASQLLDQSLPTFFQRMFPVFEGSTNPADPSYSSMLATAAIQAAQYLEASGHGPGTDQNPASVDVWQQRVQNWARNMLMFRAAFGFGAPATPAFKIQGTDLGNQLTALMATMPYSEAVAAFLKAHPDATPYTVFESTTGNVGQSGAYVPATQHAMQFIAANKSFFDRYPAAAPWLFPLSSGQGAFNDVTYQAELAMGLRARRSFGSWWQDVRYAQGANVYFPLEAKVKAAEVANPGAKQQIQHSWDLWATAFKKANPIFASMLDEPTATNRRNLVIQQMQQALADAALPKTPQSEHLALLMAGYQKVQDYYQQTQGESAYNSQHTQNKKAFLAWGDEVATAYPDVAAFWQSVLSKEVPG